MVKEEYGNGAGRIANADGASSDNLEPEQFRKIFIGGLSSVTDENSMKSFYEQYGTVIDCVVMRDPQTKRSRGFGFVSFTSMDGVDAAMSNRPHEIDGKTVDPKRAVPREDSSRGQKLPSTNRLYVSGVREGHTEEMLKEYFSQFGTVEKVEIMMDKATGKPRGFGFITFDDYDPVDKCVLKKSHTINDYRCDVKKGLSKEEMAKVQQGDRDRSARGERSGGWGGSRGQPMGWGAGGDRPVYGSGGQTWGQGGGWGGAGGPSGAPRGGYEQSGWGQGYGGGQGGYGGGYSGGGQAGYSGGGQGGYGGAGYGGYGGQGGGWGQQQQQGDPWRRNY